MRYELSDYQWTAIKPMLPNKSRGVRRVNDRRVSEQFADLLHGHHQAFDDIEATVLRVPPLIVMDFNASHLHLPSQGNLPLRRDARGLPFSRHDDKILRKCSRHPEPSTHLFEWFE